MSQPASKSHRSIMAVGLTTLCVAISTAALFSVSPFFLNDVLHISLKGIGAIETGTEALSQLFRLISGVISDVLQRNKPMFFLGTLCSAIARPFFVFAQGAGFVVISKIFDRLGNGISATPRDAFVASHSPADKRGANLGLVMTFKTAGCVLGPWLVAGILAWRADFDTRILLWIISIPSFIAVVLCLFGMHEKKVEPAEKGKREEGRSFSFRAVARLPRTYWLFLMVMSLFYLARAPESFMLLSLRDSGLPKWFCTGTIGFFNLVSVLISFPSGWLSDKIGRSRVLIISFATLLLALTCFALGSPVCGVLGVALWGVQRASSQILSVACISDLVPKNVLGTAIGMLNLLTAFASIASGYGCGYLADRYSFHESFFASATVSCIALLGLCYFARRSGSLAPKAKA